MKKKDIFDYDFMKEINIPREFEGEIRAFDALVNATERNIDEVVKLITSYFPGGSMAKEVYFFILHVVQIRPRNAEVLAEIWKRVYQVTRCQINYQRYRDCHVGFFFLHLLRKNLIDKGSIIQFIDSYSDDDKKFLAFREYIPEIETVFKIKLPEYDYLCKDNKMKLKQYFRDDAIPGTLMHAIKFDNLSLFQNLIKGQENDFYNIDLGREFNIQPWSSEFTIYHVVYYAAFWGSLKIFTFCLLNMDCLSFHSIVGYAVAGGNPDVINLALLQPGKTLQHALDAAIFFHRYEYIDRCLKLGFDDCSDIVVAAQGMSIPMVLYYINKKQNINMTGENRYFPLYAAARNGHISMLRLLLQNGADPNQKFDDGMTAMHRCAQYGHLEMISALKAAGGDINAKTDYGDTPLKLAAEVNGEMTVQYLVQMGARVDI